MCNKMAVNQQQNHSMNELTTRTSSPGCLKVFIHRDYSEGTNVKFQTKFPPELDGRIDKVAFEYTVTTLNDIYVEAEAATSKAYCESCMACLTAYLVYMCVETHYEKCLKRIMSFIQEQNKNVYLPKGLLLTDPVERGLRVIEIAVLNEPAASRP